MSRYLRKEDLVELGEIQHRRRAIMSVWKSDLISDYISKIPSEDVLGMLYDYMMDDEEVDIESIIDYLDEETTE